MAALPLSFRLFGRGWHPVIEGPAELALVPELDDAYWVATAATVDTLRADPDLLRLVDTDADGRIRSDELRCAIRWLLATLKDTGGIRAGSRTLDLSHVNPAGPDSATILDAARRIQGAPGRTAGPTLSLDEVRAVRKEEEGRGLSAAGRIQAAAAGDDAPLGAFLAQVIEATGGVPHPLGDPALDAACLDRFLAEGRAWLDWHDQGQLPADGAPTAVQPLGAGTAAALEAVTAIADKMEQYFLLCDALALDPALAAPAWVDATGSSLLDREVATALLARAPLARPNPEGLLDLDGPLNPAWRAALASLAAAAVLPVHGAGCRRLDRAAWQALLAATAPLAAWKAAAPAAAVGAAGPDLLRAHLDEPRFAEQARALLAQSEVAAVLLDGVRAVEKLLLLQAGILALANSFVAMPDLFAPDRRALFEQGQLVIDGRVFRLAVKVNDAGRAERFSAMSPMFVMFILVGDEGGKLTDQYMVPVTAGERGTLVEGMWGVFFDIEGKERHAQIRKISSNPISIKEALMAPFRKLSEVMQNMADKAAADQTSAVSAKASSATETAVTTATSAPTAAITAGQAASAPPAAAATPAAPASPAAPTATATAVTPSGMSGQLPLLIAGGGVALAAVTSALAYVVDLIWSGAGALAAAFLALPFVAALPAGAASAIQVLVLPVALILILLGVCLVPFLIYAVPVSIATWLRLRRRDLATLLEGSGWAINTRIFLTKDTAGRFTSRPEIPVSSMKK